MRKKIVLLLTTILMVCLCALGLTACGSSVSGNYYYVDPLGEVDMKTFIKLDGKSWSNSEGISGTFEIEDDIIIFYVELFGEKTEWTSAPIKDGVIKMNSFSGKMTYVSENHKHTYDEWKKTSEPNCTEDGLETRTCACGIKESRSWKPALGHNWGEWEKTSEPNCTEDGLETRTCACGIKENRPWKPALGHNWGEWKITAATCTENGLKTHTCKTCEATDSEIYEPPKGHNWGYRFDEESHWKGCLACNNMQSETLSNHTSADGKVCDTCKYPITETEGLEYTINDDNTYSVSGLGSFTGTSIRIPSTYNGLPVTEIANYAFRYYNINIVIIPNSVTYIGHEAFASCTSLTSITIPDSVTSIDDYAFYDCTNLIQVENGVQYVDKWVVGCEQTVTTVTLRNNTKGIATCAFNNCSSLTSITIPDSVTCIGKEAFNGCYSLANITVNENNQNYKSVDNCILTKDGKTLITVNKSLTTVTIPDGVTTIRYDAFYDCKFLTNITIPDSVTYISNDAFKNCPIETATIPAIACKAINKSSLKTVIITSGISIISGAFKYHTSLTSVTIPDSVTSIGSDAFAGCSNLIKSENGVQYVDKWVIGYEQTVTTVTLRNNTKGIATCAFKGCSSLKSIVIPDSVTSIGDHAFYNCGSLESITIPDSVISIGNYAYNGCSSLKSITISDRVTYIGTDAFKDCPIETATIPAMACSWIDNKNLKTVNITSGTSIISSAFKNRTSLTSVTIPDSVTSIGSNAFENCTSLSNLTIPDSVTSIGSDAFAGCSSLIKSENGVQYVDKWVIDCNTTVTTVTLRNNTKGIADSTFYGCDLLKSITIPDSVISIGKKAFNGCSSLKSITVNENNQNYKSVNNCILSKDGKTLIIAGKTLTSLTIPDGVIKIGDDAFNYCTSLTSITIPNSVTEIGGRAFYRCYSLASITIPDGVIKIGDDAFTDCSSLKSIMIPDSVTKIGFNAFRDCRSLTDINFKGSKSQWMAINKVSGWDDYTGDYTIHCTDGDIAK